MFSFGKLRFNFNQYFLNNYGIYFDNYIDSKNKFLIPYPSFGNEHQHYFWKIYKSYRKNCNVKIFEKHITRYKCKLHYYMGYLKNDICEDYNQNYYYDIDKISIAYPENINENKISKYLGLILLISAATIEAILTFPRLYSIYQLKCDLMKVLVHNSTLGHLKISFTVSKNVLKFENIQPLRKEMNFHLRLIEYYFDIDKNLDRYLDYFKIYSDIDQLNNLLKLLDRASNLIQISCQLEKTLDNRILNNIDKFVNVVIK